MTTARSNSVTPGEIEFHHTWSRCVQRAWLARHGVEFDERYVWDLGLIGIIVPLQGDGVGDFRTQGGAALCPGLTCCGPCGAMKGGEQVRRCGTARRARGAKELLPAPKGAIT
jgi:hypothetical protein